MGSRQTLLILLSVKLLLFIPGHAGGGLDEDTKVRIASVCYGVDAALIKSGHRLENGPVQKPFGFNSHTCLAPWGNPCLPDDVRPYGQYALAHVIFMQKYLLRDPYMRRQYLRAFAVWYHDGTPEEDAIYAKDLNKIFVQERARMESYASPLAE